MPDRDTALRLLAEASWSHGCRESTGDAILADNLFGPLMVKAEASVDAILAGMGQTPGVGRRGAPIPLLTFNQAERVGQALHDRWVKMTGAAPLSRDDLGWGDVVQFVIRTAREVVDGR